MNEFTEGAAIIGKVSTGNVKMSPSIGKLAEALSKAQGLIIGSAKDAANPFYKSRYSSLSSVLESFREAFTANGLSIVQIPGRNGVEVTVDTILAHSSGEWISGVVGVKPVKDDAQGLGSVITYLRRYAVAAFAGVAQIDDDGEGAVGRESTDKPKVSIAKATREEFARQVRDCMSNGDSAGLKALWSEWGADERVVLWAMFNSEERRAMKDIGGAG